MTSSPSVILDYLPGSGVIVVIIVVVFVMVGVVVKKVVLVVNVFQEVDVDNVVEVLCTNNK
jgi:hypothetical protein